MHAAHALHCMHVTHTHIHQYTPIYNHAHADTHNKIIHGPSLGSLVHSQYTQDILHCVSSHLCPPGDESLLVFIGEKFEKPDTQLLANFYYHS